MGNFEKFDLRAQGVALLIACGSRTTKVEVSPDKAVVSPGSAMVSPGSAAVSPGSDMVLEMDGFSTKVPLLSNDAFVLSFRRFLGFAVQLKKAVTNHHEKCAGAATKLVYLGLCAWLQQ